VGDEAVIEVSVEPHTGCVKFANRFGRDAHKLVWSEAGREARLRGLNARVVVAGVIRPGDTIRVLGGADTVSDASSGTSAAGR
jgi:MOSC domain-containing protein YiiM